MYIVRCRETERLYICYRLQFHKSCDKPRLLATRKETPPPKNFIHFCIPVLHPKTKSSKRFHDILLCRTMHACTPLQHTVQQWGPTAAKPNFRSVAGLTTRSWGSDVGASFWTRSCLRMSGPQGPHRRPQCPGWMLNHQSHQTSQSRDICCSPHKHHICGQNPQALLSQGSAHLKRTWHTELSPSFHQAQLPTVIGSWCPIACM